MQTLAEKDLQHYTAKSLVRLAVEQSESLAVCTRIIKAYEREIEKLAVELGTKNQTLLFSIEVLNRLRQARFGPSSERRVEDDTSPLFGSSQDNEDSPFMPEAKSEETPPAKVPKPRTKTGRTPQPGILTQDVHHHFTEEDIKEAGLVEWEGQTEDSELITVIPTQFVLEKHKRHKYFRKNPNTGEREIVTAPGPLKLKEASRYSVEFAVETGLAKYHWHLPLDRQVKMMEALGLEVKSQTLYEQAATVAFYLKNSVFKKINEDVKTSYVTIADDTTWKNLAAKDQRETSKFYLWAVMNQRAVAFNIYDSRSQRTAKNFLGELKGVLVSDGHQSFKILANPDLKLANDWYHARRKFLNAEATYPEESKWFVAAIRALSKIEEEIKGQPSEVILEARQTRSKPIIDAIRAMMDSLAHILPQSSLGRALAYTDKLWGGLTVFLTDPNVPIDSNAVERVLRGPAVGRKNHYGSKNLETAKTAAIWYAVVETCKLNGVSPRDYIVSTLYAILAKEPYQMPWEWKLTPAAELILN